MFSNTMEVDCSLEEFARVLVAHGYINDESCFSDSDIPSMLYAFDSPEVLISQDNYSSSPYANGDLSRTLEIAQMPNCLEDGLSHLGTAVHDFNSCSKEDAFAVDSSFQESHLTIPTSLQPKINRCSKDIQNNNRVIANAPLDINFLDIKEADITKPSSLHVTDPPHPTASHLNNTNCKHEHIYHSDNSYVTNHSADLQDDTIVVHTDSSLGSEVPATQDNSQEGLPRLKQKRKRRNKGYSKPTKSKKKKSKTSPEVNSHSKTIKQRKIQDSVQQDMATTEVSSFGDRTDVIQDDSGFESGDKQTCPSSAGSETSGSDPANTNSEPALNSEANKSLRRSSRTTRNTENYNLRLSSLVKRVETERRQETPRQPKDKSKPAPLSKYRRRTANARERDRMKEINDAFDNLRSSLPSIQRDDGKQKVTKFTILKHALNYIASLRDILSLDAAQDDDLSSDFSSVRPASVMSSVGEDSCSSPTSGPHQLTSQHVSGFFLPERPTGSDAAFFIDAFPQPSPLSAAV